MIKTFQAWLAGWKTHSINAAGLVAAGVGYATGQMTPAQAISAALLALGLSTFRSAMARYHDQIGKALAVAQELNDANAKETQNAVTSKA